jgi:hypothetical protein
LVFTVVVLIFASQYFIAAQTSSAASQSDFSTVSNAITSAYVATHNAELKGGNVSSLITKLNAAVDLVQKAQAENSSDASQASADLQNATQLAEQVSSDSAGIGQSGASARSTQTDESIGASAAIIAVAILIYIFGGRIYRRAWLYLYKDYIVRPV